MPQDRSTAAESPLASVLHVLFRAAQKADRLFALNAGVALTLRQLMVLQAVAEADAPNQTELGAATGIDRSSMADLAKRLVSYGWLRRRRTKGDARSYVVSLTKEGQRVLALGMPAARATEKSLLSSLSAEERPIFVRALTTLALETPARVCSTASSRMGRGK